MSRSDGGNTHHKEDRTTGHIRAFRAIAVIAVMAVVGYFVVTTTTNPDSEYSFRLGLDLSGGSHLVYEADVSGVDQQEVPELMGVLRDVIERRVNVFGVSEPIVQVETSSFVTEETAHRLVVELPGVSDVDEAVAEIGRTPLLEFRLIDEEALDAQQSAEELTESATGTTDIPAEGDTENESGGGSDPYIDTGLTGRFLERADLAFGQGQGSLSNEPIVNIEFNDEGAELFAQITRENVGEQLAIFLDGEMVSSPVINETITGGRAVISGDFTPDEARDLVQNLNFGALPLPIELESTQTIGASLGEEILDRGITAGVIGFVLVIGFMVLWYRLPGVVAGLALISYVLMMLALFKLISVTLTAAGLAGFILSLGMAVDANVLVFERMKEEYKNGRSSLDAAHTGFSRAWTAIRDGNITSLLSAAILFWFGTSIVKGFALVFGLGVIVSMLSALLLTRTLLLVLPETKREEGTALAKLYETGFSK